MIRTLALSLALSLLVGYGLVTIATLAPPPIALVIVLGGLIVYGVWLFTPQARPPR